MKQEINILARILSMFATGFMTFTSEGIFSLIGGIIFAIISLSFIVDFTNDGGEKGEENTDLKRIKEGLGIPLLTIMEEDDYNKRVTDFEKWRLKFASQGLGEKR